VSNALKQDKVILSGTQFLSN